MTTTEETATRPRTVGIDPEVYELCERARDVINGERARTGTEKRLTMKAYFEKQLRETAESIIASRPGTHATQLKNIFHAQ